MRPSSKNGWLNIAKKPILNIKSNRKYNIIVFGASRFIGQLVVMEMGRFSQTYNLTWAVAGRNTDKLQNILEKLYKTLGRILHRQLISMRNYTKEWCLAFPEPDQAVIARSILHAKT